MTPLNSPKTAVLLKRTPVSWITIRTLSTRWEAEFMQQMLIAHQIPTRLIDLGMAPYFGALSPTALQVPSAAQWDALLLLSPIEEEPAEN